jgi:acetolactate synthase-1/2/3 large subunit
MKTKYNEVIKLISSANKPILYCGGGIINSGDNAVKNLYELAKITNFPVATTLMGLGCYPSSDKQCLQMLGMHGSYEANRHYMIVT